MKRLPEKMVMAAIILSCGYVSHLDNSMQIRKPKPQHKVNPAPTWFVAPTTVAAAHPAKVAKFFDIREDVPK